jgi:NADPH:quinone reductase-like Zn-dependent oxidoreductase
VTAHKAGVFAAKANIPGTDVAGRVEAVGSAVTQFQVGDEVFGMAERFGAFAEYLCVSENAPMVAKPGTLSFEQAAALPQASHIALAVAVEVPKDYSDRQNRLLFGECC